MPSIDNVQVSAQTGTLSSPVCNPTAFIIYITFFSPSGNLPPLTFLPDVSSACHPPTDIAAWLPHSCSFFLPTANFNLGTTHEYEVKAGTTDYAECGGRGVCNHDTGTCRCFVGYGSSDGGGGKGGRDDCGYRVPYTPTDTRDSNRRWENDMRDDYKRWQRRDKIGGRRSGGEEEFRRGSAWGRDTMSRLAARETERGWRSEEHDSRRWRNEDQDSPRSWRDGGDGWAQRQGDFGLEDRRDALQQGQGYQAPDWAKPRNN